MFHECNTFQKALRGNPLFNISINCLVVGNALSAKVLYIKTLLAITG